MLEPEASTDHQLWDYGVRHARSLQGRITTYGFPSIELRVHGQSQTARIEFKEHGEFSPRQICVHVHWPEFDRNFAWRVTLGSQEERGCRKKIRHNINKASRFLDWSYAHTCIRQADVDLWDLYA